MSTTTFILSGILLLIIFLVSEILFYNYFKRMIKFYKNNYESEKIIKIISLLISFLFLVFAFMFMPLGLLVFIYTISFCIIYEIISIIIKKITKRETFFEKLVKSGILVFITLISFIGHGIWNVRHIVKMEYTLENDSLSGLKIGMITDVHMGVCINVDEIEETLRDLEKEKIDILFLVGDIFDEMTSDSDAKKACELFGNIKTTYGTYFVYGNHDLGRYKEPPCFTEKELTEEFEKNGVTVLTDETMIIDDLFYVTGRRDASFIEDFGRKTIEELLEGIDKTKPIILLDHQPLDFEIAKENGVTLQLSGHTHAGQISPFEWLIEKYTRYDLIYGIKNNGKSNLIVSAGLGVWGFPLRIGSECEYVIIKFK